MNFKKLSIFLLLTSYSLSSTLEDIKKQTLLNNQNLNIIQNDIKISQQDEQLSTKWKNIILGFGVNDLLINDLGARDKEAMQNQYITLTQSIPLGDKLENKRKMSRTQGKIYKLLLEDKKVKYNALLNEYVNEYVIVEKQVWLLSNLKKNIQKISQLQKQKFKLTSSKQIDILNNNTKYVRYDLKREKLLNKLELLKLKIQNISYAHNSKISHILEEQKLINVDIEKLLKSNNMYKAIKASIDKSKENIDLQNSLKQGDIKVKIGYYQREEFEDYLSFSLSYPLSIYGSENIKVNKAKQSYLKNNSKLLMFKNEFRIKVKSILFDMQLAHNNYNLIISKVIASKKTIQKILESQSGISKSNSIEQLTNKNSLIEESLNAIAEQSKFYKAKAQLKYYQGKSL